MHRRADRSIFSDPARAWAVYEPHPKAPHAADLYVLEQGAAKANNP